MKWTADQDEKLEALYPSAPLADIIAATGRSKLAIYSRAKLRKLKRQHSGGFKVGNTIRNRVVAKVVPTLSERILQLINDSGEAWTTPAIRERLGNSQSAVTTAVGRWHSAGKLHIQGWRPSAASNGPKLLAAYSAGDEDDAERPQYSDTDDGLPRPIPYSVLPFFHYHVFKPAPQAERITE